MLFLPSRFFYIDHDIVIDSTVAVLIDMHALDSIFGLETTLFILQISVNINVLLSMLCSQLLNLSVCQAYFFIAADFFSNWGQTCSVDH